MSRLALRLFPNVPLFLFLALLGCAAAPAVRTQRPAPVAPPLSFEVNRGQADASADFLARGRGYSIFLGAQGPTLSLSAGKGRRTAAVRMELVGARRDAALAAERRLPGEANYLLGADPAKWRRHVPTYGRVRQAEVYRGIDLVYYGNQRQLEYDFIVKPGADPRQIALAYGEPARVDAAGNLVLTAGEGQVVQHRPVIYQERDGRHVPIDGGYHVHGEQVGFRIGAYDRRRPLVIDPVLTYSSYLGGSGGDTGMGIAVDADGFAYVVGQTTSAAFPIEDARQPALAGKFDAFITKVSADGLSVIYSTYLGGSDDDGAQALAVDATGSPYVVGTTASGNFPLSDPLQASLNNGDSTTRADGFVTRLSADGSTLLFSTHLGGSQDDLPHAVALDPDGNIYVAGETTSDDFPTANALRATLTRAGDIDGFLTKITADGSALIYSTYLGGTGFNHAYGVAADSGGNAYVTGDTTSATFPTANARDTSIGGGQDAWVAKVNPAGSAFVYSTYLGGSEPEIGRGIAVDPGGNAYVTGTTYSTDYPTTPGVVQPEYAGGMPNEDAFVTKINADGSSLAYSTYLGATGEDAPNGIAVSAAGEASIAGFTMSPTFPGAAGVNAGGFGVFVSGLNAGGTALRYSMLLGSPGDDIANAVAVDATGAAFVTGVTGAQGFPSAGPSFQPSYAGGAAAFIARIGDPVVPSADVAISATVQPDPQDGFAAGATIQYQITLTNTGPTAARNVLATDDVPPVVRVTRIAASTGGRTAGKGNHRTVTFGALLAGESATVTITAAIDPGAGQDLAIDNTVTVSATTADPNASNNSATATFTATNTGGGSLGAPDAVAFGTVRRRSTRTRSITLRNASSNETLNVLVAAPEAPFGITRGGGSARLGPGKKRVVAVRFRPTAPGETAGTLRVYSSDPAKPVVEIALTGTGR